MTLSGKTNVTTKNKTKLFKSIYSEETRRRMSEAKMGDKNPNFGKRGSNAYTWKGGSYTYYHQLAREMFATDYCQKCGIKLEDKKSDQEFDMHCWYDYTQLREDNWTCICRSCHKIIHHEINKLKDHRRKFK